LEPSQSSFARYHHLARLRPVVDVMLTNAGTFAKLLAESRLVTITGCVVRVPAPLHLVAMKLHALKQQPDRAYKDWPDICHLLENYRDEWTPAELQALAERYASEQFATELRMRGLL
jgi:predicted nucleotidyltransferase